MTIDSVRAIALANVPIGRANALPARSIWRRGAMWSVVAIKNQLRGLAREGVIRCEVARGDGTLVYWKESP